MGSEGLGSVLPPLYARWIGNFLGGPVAPETRATCADCAMCAPAGAVPEPSPPNPQPPTGEAPKADRTYFHPSVKCCSYHPELANFLVGRILGDPDPSLDHGRAALEARLQAREAVTPRGVGAPAAYQALFGSKTLTFGQSLELLCPYFVSESGTCGIWRHREATCTTWFCKHLRGAVGERFWQVLQQLLAAVDMNLAHWCMLELDVGPETVRRLWPHPADRAAARPADGQDAGYHQALWGAWAGREREYFLACARLVDPLGWEEVLERCGPSVRLLALRLAAAYAELASDALPSRLRAGPFKILESDSPKACVVSYRSSDPLLLPPRLLDLLPYFDGRPREEALRRIALEQRVRIDEGLLRTLVDFEILVPGDEGCTP